LENKVAISVIMSVYNASEYLVECMDSILNQTFDGFEFIIIDDCSTDNTCAMIEAYKDPRIRLYKNEVNEGLTRNLNKAITLATGKYIARMDADDISLPKRFERQYEFMEKNPEVGLCGTWYEIFGDYQKIVQYKTDHDEIVLKLLYQSQFNHPSVMMRKEVLDRFNIKYNTDYTTAQDYELWPRLTLVCKVTNIPEVLLRYRFHSENISTRKRDLQNANALKIRLNHFKNLGVSDITPEEIEVYTALMHQEYVTQKSKYKVVESLLRRMVKGNETTKRVSETTFNKHIAATWYHYNYNILGKAGAAPFADFLTSRLTKKYFNLPWIIKAMIK
jgi:glycosyltransferase involved in cell wall biosynthesis